MIYAFPTEAEAQAIAAKESAHLWNDMGTWRVFTGEDMPKQPEPEQTK
jgi:hypothetical protein